MRATDKFCASCGTPAAPRPAKPRAAAPVVPEPSAPTPSAQSNVESFRAPLPTTPASARQPELGFSASPTQAAPAPAPTRQPAPLRPAPVAPAPLSWQQEQQVLLEAEEIASVRGMAPVEALPPEFPSTPRVSESRRCEYCGEPNAVGNGFCERCGQPMQADPAAQAPAPVAHSAWLDVPEPARKPVAAPARTPTAPKPEPAPVRTAAAAPAGKDDEFFYFYDDKSPQRSNLKLLIILMVVLALGILSVIYLMSRSSTKSPAGGNVAITISPSEAEVSVGEAHDFSATVTGSGDTDVTWSVAEGSAGGTVVNRGAQAQGGAVASLGVYIAPNTPGTYHVIATSRADPSKSATAEALVSGK